MKDKQGKTDYEYPTNYRKEPTDLSTEHLPTKPKDSARRVSVSSGLASCKQRSTTLELNFCRERTWSHLLDFCSDSLYLVESKRWLGGIPVGRKSIYPLPRPGVQIQIQTTNPNHQLRATRFVEGTQREPRKVPQSTPETTTLTIASKPFCRNIGCNSSIIQDSRSRGP